MRRLRLILVGAALLLLPASLVFRLLASRLERRIEARVAAEAARVGATGSVERVAVAPWPPLRLTGLVLERLGLARVRVEDVSARPRLGGRSGFRPHVRLGIGSTTVSLPGELELRLYPTQWDWDGASTTELVAPSGGLTLRVLSDPEGRHVEIRTTQLDVERLGQLRLEGTALRPGAVDAELRWEHSPQRRIEALWRVRAIGAECAGTVTVVGSAGQEQLNLTLEVDSLDFTRLFAALGLELPAGASALGSLRAAVGASGALADPASLVVTQRLDFTPPPRLPSAIERLRGDFTHEVAVPGGSRRAIHVSPDSPDFVARADLPPLLVKTLLLAEDSAFFSHRGLDLSELPKAIGAHWVDGGSLRGASTITQQLAKNLFLSPERSLKRKLQELALAFLLESALGKDRILEIYLNVIEWGPGLYGLRPAARHYFGKEPRALTPKEMAFLVVLIPSPVRYQRSFTEGALSPGLEPLVANLLAKLRSLDALSEEEYASALAETLAFRRPEQPAVAPER